MVEIWLTEKDLKKISEFVSEINPTHSLRLGAGSVKLEYDNSSGIGSILRATTTHEYSMGKFGELTITISDESQW